MDRSYGAGNRERHDVFETVTANVRAAIAAGLHVQLKITPSAYMLPWVDRIMEYAGTLGAEDVNVNVALFEANKDTGRSMEDFGLSLEENARIHRKYRDMFPRKPEVRRRKRRSSWGTFRSMNHASCSEGSIVMAEEPPSL